MKNVENPEIRITPAHAGKSYVLGVWLGDGRDHPRTRGEKHWTKADRVMYRGSPPHTRGKEEFKDSGGKSVRITPAHAGKRLNGSRF